MQGIKRHTRLETIPTMALRSSFGRHAEHTNEHGVPVPVTKGHNPTAPTLAYEIPSRDVNRLRARRYKTESMGVVEFTSKLKNLDRAFPNGSKRIIVVESLTGGEVGFVGVDADPEILELLGLDGEIELERPPHLKNPLLDDAPGR